MARQLYAISLNLMTKGVLVAELAILAQHRPIRKRRFGAGWERPESNDFIIFKAVFSGRVDKKRISVILVNKILTLKSKLTLFFTGYTF